MIENKYRLVVSDVTDRRLIGRFVRIWIWPGPPGRSQTLDGYLLAAEPIPSTDMMKIILEIHPGEYIRRTVTRGRDMTRARLYVCQRCIDQAYRRLGGPPHAPEPTCRMGRRSAHCTCAGCW